MTHKCRKCGIELIIGENVAQSMINHHKYICRTCNTKENRVWAKKNIEKTRNAVIKYRRKNGGLSMSVNRECSSFLGVHVAERVLSHAFKNVQRMPYGNPGFDFICGGGYKIDVKSSCRRRHEKKADNWIFYISKNKTPDYFLCLAFDNRELLNPEHVWLIPGIGVNHLTGASISETTLDKWSEYELNADRVSTCCDIMRGD